MLKLQNPFIGKKGRIENWEEIVKNKGSNLQGN